ncbi:HNH homing endonuclease [Pectobacterium phage Khlen]|uniref:HNH homing endonuclease n=3 Tax=Phimunavirus TaxID=2560202 RepID=A0A3G8FJP6_9CAUD|nr:HNH homing endonuclease [Pectobacterium phage PP90]YP_009817181.1 HNH homing endonuclease [Pectobacterium phage Khlen]ANT45379.1 HNH homing endonuclease [Pectobacterium phage PP90]AZF94555.1 HNH homing endonuclease [Pectobacterium phage Khlen]AZF95046.1 HNH homing endonuclease [Pectobacterium phage Zenivior_B1]
MKIIPTGLRDQFSYNKDTGVIIRLARQGNYQANTHCTSVCTTGNYLKITYRGTQYLQHRVAWFLHYGTQPPDVIDHVNGNGLDNRIVNLREATTSTNQMNIKATSKSTTGVKGIFPVRGGKLYRAEVCIDGKRYQKHAADPKKLEAWVVNKRNELHGTYANH